MLNACDSRTKFRVLLKYTGLAPGPDLGGKFGFVALGKQVPELSFKELSKVM